MITIKINNKNKNNNNNEKDNNNCCVRFAHVQKNKKES